LPPIPSKSRPNNPDVQPPNFNARNNTLQKKMGESTQAASLKAIDACLERTTTESSLGKRASQTGAQFDEDNDSSSDLMSTNEVEADIANVEQETMTSDIPATDEGGYSSGRNTTSCICFACGTELSCKTALLRHQKNSKSRNNQILVALSTDPNSRIMPPMHYLRESISKQ
jgi:hypothetical protein